MTFVLALGTGLAIDDAEAQAAHRAFLSAVGRIRACVDPNPAERVHDIVLVEGRATVLAADPRGQAQAVPSATAQRILADAARYGLVSWSAGVAACLALSDGLGLPADPALALRLGVVSRADTGWRLQAPGAAFDAATVTWNGELRELATIDPAAEWLADEGLAKDDVRALNGAVHDLFEFAWSHALVVRVGQPRRHVIAPSAP